MVKGGCLHKGMLPRVGFLFSEHMLCADSSLMVFQLFYYYFSYKFEGKSLQSWIGKELGICMVFLGLSGRLCCRNMHFFNSLNEHSLKSQFELVGQSSLY